MFPFIEVLGWFVLDRPMPILSRCESYLFSLYSATSSSDETGSSGCYKFNEIASVFKFSCATGTRFREFETKGVGSIFSSGYYKLPKSKRPIMDTFALPWVSGPFSSPVCCFAGVSIACRQFQ